jgi:hypothetical protein
MPTAPGVQSAARNLGGIVVSWHIRSVSACVGLAALAAVFVGGVAAHADPVPDPIVNPALVELAASSAAPGTPESAVESGLSSDGDAGLVVDEVGRVLVEVEFADAGGLQSGLDAVAALGEVSRVAQSEPDVFVSVSTDRFDDLAGIPGVVEVSPALSAVTSSADATPATSTTTASSVPAGSCRTLPSDLDTALGTAGVRADFGVDGTGVVVGILSDSFAADPTARTTPAQDVVAGALPGPGNPCGYGVPVRVLAEDTTGEGKDEGRAMAQIIHSAAPGARLLFAAAGPGQSTLADSVRLLHAAGATVIVDDVWFPEETLWQRGVVATALAEAEADGITVISSAGNATQIGLLGDTAGQSIGSWEATSFSATDCPAAILADLDPAQRIGVVDCADMSGGSGQPRATLTFAASTAEKKGTIMTQWSEPMYGLTTHIHPVVVDHSTGRPVGPSVQPDRDTPSVTVDLAAHSSGTYDIVLVRQRIDPAEATPDSELRIKWKTTGVTLTALQDTSSPTVVVGPTVWAHAGDPATIAAAAASVGDTGHLEDFSSSGPSLYLFEPIHADRTPSPRYAEPITLLKPQITGLDGEQTTFFGQNSTDAPDVWRFYGTSAAAPSIAAVAALAQAAAPTARAADIRREMLLTADDVSVSESYAGPTTSAWIGAGLIDPDGLLEALVGPTPAPPTPAPAPAANAAPAKLADTGAASGDAQQTAAPLLGLAALALAVGALLTARRRLR